MDEYNRTESIETLPQLIFSSVAKTTQWRKAGFYNTQFWSY
jgi:hypothetical protein